MLRALLGASQVALGEVDEGRRLLREIADAYPGSDAATLAAASLATAPEGGRP
jgi:TolA-binding protein